MASLFFYSWWNPVYLPLMLASIFVNYRFGIWIGSSVNGQKKLIAFIGVIINLGLIAYFKYANFFIDSLVATTALNINIQQVILPLAISFFTFQQIAYLVDIYKGQPSEKDLATYCLFVTFFPQLIAGPIVRHYEMLPQFHGNGIGNISENIAQGFSLFVIGLFKKVVMADSLAQYASPIFLQADNNLAVTFSEAWIGAMAYSFQLYFDFSGYSDMALGLALMFGVRLPINFFSPYKSHSIIDFWRNWHVTLSRFLRDYLYIPLGGGRSGKIRRYINLLVTMILGGLWHGASWNFVVWGGVHGLLLVVNNIWRQFCNRWMTGISLPSTLVVPASILATFILVTTTWVIFRAETISGAANMLSAMFVLGNTTMPDNWMNLLEEVSRYGNAAKSITNEPIQLAIDFNFVLLMLSSIVVVWFVPNTAQIFQLQSEQTEHKVGTRLHWLPQRFWLIVIALMLLTSLEFLSNNSEFLYFQF
jgi:alginate O-acetyltransferase complex protein AlgI